MGVDTAPPRAPDRGATGATRGQWEGMWRRSRGTHLATNQRWRVGGWACVAGPSPGPNTLLRRRHPSEGLPSRSITLHAPSLAGRGGAEESCRLGFSPPAGPNTPARRLFADRRSGSDQRVNRRRNALASVSLDLRQRVDRRGCAERRSTLERRSHVTRHAYTESPSEHLRNALQLLDQLTIVSDLDMESRADLAAGLEQVRRALGMLERRRGV